MSFPKLETPASARRLSGICLGLGAALALGLSSWAYGQDCGVGDVSSAELCLVDEDVDNVNGGCNSDPAVFEPANLDGSMDGTVSTYLITVACVDDTDCAPGELCIDGMCLQETRDTDWYLITQADLVNADLDGNGVVQIQSTLTSEFDGVTFFLSFNPDCDSLGFPGSVGFSGAGCIGGEPAVVTLIIDEHPAGIVVFVSSGEPDGTPIRSGFECFTGNNDYLLTLESIELPTVCAPGSGVCAAPNATPGCEDPACCAAVCAIDPLCCLEGFEWTQGCADIAIGLNCAAVICDPAGTIVFDHIGGTDGNLGGTIYASQRFPDFPTFDIVAAESFTVAPPGFQLTCAEVVIDGFGDNWPGNFDAVTSWAVEIYSSAEAAATNLTGDVASFVGPPTSMVPFGGSFLAQFDLTGGPGPGVEIGPGTYYIGLLPTMTFDVDLCCGQTAVRQSLIGNDAAIQANPGGGFEFPGNLSNLNANLAFRLVGTELKGVPCPWDLDVSGDVGVSDFLELLGAWGPCPPKGDCPADFDVSGDVGVSDFLELLGNWGPCP